MNDKEMIEIKHGSENICDLLNQEQAELKKAMIEGIAEVIGFSCGAKSTDDCDEFDDCDVCRATDVYNAGYRKIPEGAVVLTDDNLEQIANMIVTMPQIKDVMDELIKKWQKETAREILKAVVGAINNGTFSTKSFIFMMGKVYGVEVEE